MRKKNPTQVKVRKLYQRWAHLIRSVVMKDMEVLYFCDILDALPVLDLTQDQQDCALAQVLNSPISYHVIDI